jgi:hypothetical protein
MVTHPLNLRFDMETVDTPCTHYLLHQGFTSGCVLPAQRGVLHLTIRNETHILDTRSRLASDFCKSQEDRSVPIHLHPMTPSRPLPSGMSVLEISISIHTPGTVDPPVMPGDT